MTSGGKERLSFLAPLKEDIKSAGWFKGDCLIETDKTVAFSDSYFNVLYQCRINTG